MNDEGNNTTGAFFMIMLNSNGTVKSYQEVSVSAGGFAGVAQSGDEVASVCNIGDFDGDGVTDLAVGAQGDDDGGSNRGAIYLMMMNPNGTVKSYSKISDTQGGFTGGLDNGDKFGFEVNVLGDIDGNGVVDLITGCIGDDDGGSNQEIGRAHV